MQNSFLYCFALLLFCFSISVHSQHNQKVDSLNNVFKSSTNDTTKVIALQYLFDHYLYSEPDSAVAIYKRIFALSKAKSFDWGIYHGYLYKSYYHWSSSELDSVISTMQQALEVAIRLQDAGKQSQCYARIAMAYTYLGNYTEAKKLTYKALEIAQNSNDWKGLYYAYYRLGNTYYYENDFNNALKNYLKVDSIFQHHDRKEPALAASLANIGSIYMEFKNFDRAREYFIESQELYKDMDREEGVVFSNFNLAKVEFNKGNYQESIDILEPALSYYQKINNRGELADISGWLGAAHLKLKQYQLAYENYKNSYQWSVDSGSKMLEANALVGLGEIAKIEGRPDRAIKDLENALVIYDSIKITYNKSQILNNLATAYSDKKEYQKALIYFQKFQKFEDSIKEVENIANFQNLETKYQTEKKEQEIALLNSEKELIEQQKVNQRNLLLGGIGISSLIGVLLFFQYRNRQKTNTKLKELDNLKSRFFANISHEFRTPLTLISNPIEKRLEAPKLTKTDRQDFEMISRNSQRLLNLVDQLLDLSKLEAGKYQLHVNRGDLGNLISAIAESFQYFAAQHHIIYKTEITDLKEVWFDKDVIEKTITNLLSNALKYTDEGGHVVLKASRKGDRAGITVENTASSLTPQILEKLFDRFYQADAHAEGAGIGLALVKELIGVYRGNIKVSKTADTKLKFEVMLPIQKSAFKANEFTSEIPESTPRSPSTTDAVSSSPEEFNELEADDDREIVLLAEDNAEVRQLLRSSFNSHYRIIEAEDGHEGMDMALEWVPDIIISDIMMPGIDGLELCTNLKTDERTSHIPIILLTAKAGEEDKLQGLSTGADAYVTKPFKTRILETHVKNLLASRKALRDRYSQEVILKPKDIAITSLDELFLERIQKVLDHKLTESSFNIQEFSEAVGMSRMQLHRKLKALTGLSASEFVRSQRLKLAAALLEKSDANVSQIGYQVGFNDPSYFTKCFKEAYGVAPSEYNKKDSS